MGPEIRDQGWFIHHPFSRILCQLYEVIVVVSHGHGTLLELFKLINKCLLVVRIEINAGKQHLKHVLGHGVGIIAEPNSLPPSMGGTRKSMSSKRNIVLYWCSQKVKSIPHRPHPLIGCYRALKFFKHKWSSLNKGS